MRILLVIIFVFLSCKKEDNKTPLKWISFQGEHEVEMLNFVRVKCFARKGKLSIQDFNRMDSSAFNPSYRIIHLVVDGKYFFITDKNISNGEIIIDKKFIYR